MTMSAGSAALVGNLDTGGEAVQVEATQVEQIAGGEGTWYDKAGVDSRFHDTIKAKDWKSPNDLLDSYTNVEKLVSLERGGEVERIIVKPKADATGEEIAAFRAKAGFTAPEDVAEYGITPDQIASNPAMGEAGKWFKEAGVPKDMADKLLAQTTAYEQAQLDAFAASSSREYQMLATEMGDRFGDFEESARRAFKVAGISEQQANEIEQQIGTRALLGMFAKFGQAMTEAAAPQPGKTGAGQFTVSAEAAQQRIKTLMRDSDFQARLNSPNPELRKATVKEWEQLHLASVPS